MKEIKPKASAREDNLFIALPDGGFVELPYQKDLLALSSDMQANHPATIVAALINGRLENLTTVPPRGSHIRFIDTTHQSGMRIYRRSLSLLLIKAAKDLFPQSWVKIEHSLGKGLYCEIKGRAPLTRDDVKRLEARMHELVKKDIPFVKEKLSLKEATDLFRSQGEEDKALLLNYMNKDYLYFYSLGRIKEYFYACLVPSTGYLKHFALKFYLPGLILRFPEEKDPGSLPVYLEQPKLFEVFREADNWQKILDTDTLGTLNKQIERGFGKDLVRVAEALHEKKIAEIADTITKARQRLRVILIAGPSSSGKTTFAQRLRIQLLVNGLRPLPVSLDDYFLDREKTPLDENGEYDFEALEAIDLNLFNEQLMALIRGEEVEVPEYDFNLGKRVYKGRKLKLQEGHPLIIEGIHSLNEKLTENIPRGSKFKIYVSALTSLSLDRHTRIHTTDTRLLRRIVRDNQFRGHNALSTLKRWPSVRRGEEKNIFPFQEEADILFNSALIYELAVLKKYAEPLLEAIPADAPEFLEAERLLNLLHFFLPLEPQEVPSNSILREFIGDSCFFG
ncbi:MAG TPA: nucleoside kinase [Firmicutes bacterium]|nr:nucleoside kinase [Bacillota bacterium]